MATGQRTTVFLPSFSVRWTVVTSFPWKFEILPLTHSDLRIAYAIVEISLNALSSFSVGKYRLSPCRLSPTQISPWWFRKHGCHCSWFPPEVGLMKSNCQSRLCSFCRGVIVLDYVEPFHRDRTPSRWGHYYLQHLVSLKLPYVSCDISPAP